VDSFEFKRNNFDLIRLLASLQVVVLHGYHHFEIEYGSLFISFLSLFPGVPIFFVVSGFLISASLERSSSITSYIQNRLLRIYPALWGCFLFSILTMFIMFTPQLDFVEFGRWTLAQLTIGQFYNPDFLRGYGVGVLNGSLWTIPVELQFYVILPFVYILLKKLNWSSFALIILILILVAINQFYIGSLSEDKSVLTKLFGVTVFPYLYIFMFGVLLQRNLSFVSKLLANKSLFLFVLYLSSAFLSSILDLNYQGSYLNPLSALMLSLLVISMAYSKVDKFGNILNGNDISYGVYIYHMIFVNMLIQSGLFSPELNLLIMILLTIIAALCSWKIIEKPALSLKKYSIKSLKNNNSNKQIL